MLPVGTGFIFPNGATLETGGTGHRKKAFLYIIENNLRDKYKEYEKITAGGEDEFLMEYMGAVKVCHYCGVHYLYVPKWHNDYIDYIVDMYERNGYQIKYFNAYIEVDVKVTEKNINNVAYNQTVVTKIDSDGKRIYTYNPKRDGD